MDIHARFKTSYRFLMLFILCVSGFHCGDNDSSNPFGSIGGAVGIKMVAIPSGSFFMGLNSTTNLDSSILRPMLPVHEVILDGFEMSATEITQRQYSFIMGNNPSLVKGEDLPVNYVSCKDAVRFCNRLSSFFHLPKCYDENTGACDFSKPGIRLPTEAEWEYACRAGTTTLYYTGNSISDLDRAGWYRDESGYTTIHEVGKKEPNKWGLYDMHGNVGEWCNDQYGAYSADLVINPTGPRDEGNRVIRGGSYSSDYFFCWSAYRRKIAFAKPSYGTGFRIVKNK